jgi:hypothetical protein
MSEPVPATAESLPFDLRAFFFEPWRGWGVACDPFGAPVGRFEARGQGRVVDGRIRLDQTLTFDSGLVQTLEWEILADEGGALTAREHRSGALAEGRQTSDGFRWVARMKAPTPIGMRTVKIESLYSMARAGEAHAVTTISLWGFRLSTASVEYRQLAAPQGADRPGGFTAPLAA